MKKFNFLIVSLLAAFSLNAQELIPNGGLKSGNGIVVLELQLVGGNQYHQMVVM